MLKLMAICVGEGVTKANVARVYRLGVWMSNGNVDCTTPYTPTLSPCASMLISLHPCAV